MSAQLLASVKHFGRHADVVDSGRENDQGASLGVSRSGAALSDVHVRTLKRAAELLGGEKELVSRLNVNDVQLAFWKDGRARMPTDIFLRAVDLVLELESFSERVPPPHSFRI